MTGHDMTIIAWQLDASDLVTLAELVPEDQWTEAVEFVVHGYPLTDVPRLCAEAAKLTEVDP